MTGSDVDRICVGLTARQRREVYKTLGKRSADDLTTGDMMVMFVADLLAKVKAVDEDRQGLLIDELHIAISTSADSKQPSFLVLMDRKYATVSGRAEILDLSSGEHIITMPRSALECICYDLTVLRGRMVAALEDYNDATNDARQVGGQESAR